MNRFLFGCFAAQFVVRHIYSVVCFCQEKNTIYCVRRTIVLQYDVVRLQIGTVPNAEPSAQQELKLSPRKFISLTMAEREKISLPNCLKQTSQGEHQKNSRAFCSSRQHSSVKYYLLGCSSLHSIAIAPSPRIGGRQLMWALADGAATNSRTTAEDVCEQRPLPLPESRLTFA